MATTQRRAAEGGEFGANGEWYDGGKFINTVADNPKGKKLKAKKGTRRVQIEPGIWVEVTADCKPLMRHVGLGAEWFRHENGTYAMRPFLPPFSRGTAYTGGYTLPEMQAFCDRYNSGERFE